MKTFWISFEERVDIGLSESHDSLPEPTWKQDVQKQKKKKNVKMRRAHLCPIPTKYLIS